MKTNDTKIIDLMKDIKEGEIQLPDFQRGWVWDDDRIKGLIASITLNYPIGAAMFLQYDGEGEVRLKYRPIEGAVLAEAKQPESLILDGQQRLTSIFASLYNKGVVNTCTDKGDPIRRFYYIDIKKSLDKFTDRREAILSIPEDKKIRTNFGKDVVLDVSTQELEFEHHWFPLNLILDSVEQQTWQNKYYEHFKYNPDVIKDYSRFVTEIIQPSLQYTIPIITLDKSTPKEAVCQVFENVNTGGVSLTVFELLTAIYAMDNYELRKDWFGDEEAGVVGRKKTYFKENVLSAVDAPAFLTAITLLNSYKTRMSRRNNAVSCKRNDILNLPLSAYQQYADSLCKGFEEASKILAEERIFTSNDLPYTTQLIPLGVLCCLLIESEQINNALVKSKLKQWYWCGVLGELYGSSSETRFANDIVDVMEWISDETKTPRTISDSYFSPMRLLSLQTKLSAAYKGIYALVLKNHSMDFISGREMDFTNYIKDRIDIHHIFPRAYCEKNNLPKKKWNSVINKTPISDTTNRKIGGSAPSKYCSKIETDERIDSELLNSYLESHWINTDLLRNDSFDAFIVDRAKKLLDAIETATGKTISGRDSEEVIAAFGEKLSYEKSTIN